jgi:protein-S-isoprenylcysteine O-methyltransferase Ste14
VSGAILPLVATVLFAIVVFRWTGDELEREGRLSGAAAAAVIALVVLHALLVLVSAAGRVGPIDLPAGARLAAGPPFVLAGLVLTARALMALGDWRVALRVRAGVPVTGGIYRRMRHPLYLGWTALLLGVAVAGASVLALALVLALAVTLLVVARREEGRPVVGAPPGTA